MNMVTRVSAPTATWALAMSAGLRFRTVRIPRGDLQNDQDKQDARGNQQGTLGSVMEEDKGAYG